MTDVPAGPGDGGARPRPPAGVVNLLKPPGMTSQQAVSRVKRLFRAPAGHAGTLDPDAAGVLPVCVGRATRLADYLVEQPKLYRFWIVFGVRTDTQDAAGRVVSRRSAAALVREQVAEAVERFQGEIWQVPPMHSALKHRGRPLYAYARRGIEVEREPRRVTVYAFRVLEFSGAGTDNPRALCEVRCGRGAYVRTLCDDVGEALGVGAHLGALLRLEAGGLTIEGAVTPDELATLPQRQALIPPAAALGFLPAVQLAPADAARVRHGVAPLPRPGVAPGLVRLLGPAGDLLAVARAEPSGALRLEKVLA